MCCESFDFILRVEGDCCCSKYHFFMSVIVGRKFSKEVLLSTAVLFWGVDLYSLNCLEISFYIPLAKWFICASETSQWLGMMELP